MSQLALPNSQAELDNPQALWDADDSYSLPGVSEVDKSWLIGVPHVVVEATFWVPKKGIGHCSVKAVIAPEDMIERALKRERIRVLNNNRPMVDPLEYVVYSDGGTGIRRQCVTLLQAAGLIDVGHADMAEAGKLGESRYDTPWPEWDRFDESTMQGETEVPSFTKNHAGGQFKIRVLGGLRDSEYDDGESVTYYWS